MGDTVEKITAFAGAVFVYTYAVKEVVAGNQYLGDERTGPVMLLD